MTLRGRNVPDRPSSWLRGPEAAFLRCSKPFARETLLTGNGNSAGLSVLVQLACKLRNPLTLRRNNGRNHAQTDFGRGIDRGTDSGRTRGGAIADRDQVQPRRGDQYAEGAGGREVQGTGRKIRRRQGQGRSLSEFAALQGQGRAGGAAARRGADAGALELEVRSDR